MDAPAPVLDRTLADPRHLLVLPPDVAPEEVEALAVSWFADAGWVGPSSLRLTGPALLTGPWQLDDALRQALDLPPWAATAMLLRCPVERAAPVPRELLGLGGLLDAFPDGEPVGAEGEALRHLHAQARRLGGALRLAGTGAVLVPDPATAVDLTVHAPVWLDPAACREVVAATLPGARLLHEDLTAELATTDLPTTDLHRPRVPTDLDDGERAWLHAEADALDRAVLAQPQVLDGYAVLAPLDAADDALEIGVAGDVPPAPVLRGLPWARAGVISYEVRWRPADPQSTLGPRPSLGARRRRDAGRVAVEQVARVLHAVVGGEVVDDDGFLVAADTLAPDTPAPDA